MRDRGQRSRRVVWSAGRTPDAVLAVSVTFRRRRRTAPACMLRAADTPPSLIAGLRERGFSLGEIGRAVGVKRGRVWEWQRGVHGMCPRNWARLTALRDVVLVLDDRGLTDPRSWLSAYQAQLGDVPYQRLATDDFASVVRAARDAVPRPKNITTSPTQAGRRRW